VSAIEVTGLTVHYGKRVAVDDLSFSVAAGEVVALLGPNGAGKSTALSAIAGGLPPTSGAISINGVDLKREPLTARRTTGFCDQPPTLYEFFTVSEHLAFVAETRGDTDTDAQRQRVGLAASLVGGVKVVLLDETLNGLDPRAAKTAREVVSGAARAGAAVLMSTHLLGVAERLCSRIAIMDRGKLKVDLSGAELDQLLAGGAGAVEALYLEQVAEAELT